MKATPEPTRLAIIAAYHKRGSYKGAAEELGLDRNVVRTWVRKYKDSGSVAVAKKSGRPRALGHAAAKKAYELLHSNETGGAGDVAAQLVSLGTTKGEVHKTTVLRAVREHGKKIGRPLVVMRGRPMLQLSPMTIKKRLAFALANKKRCWDRVMFTDRKRFYFYYPGAKVRPFAYKVRGERWEAPGPNHPQSLNIYLGITRVGVTQIHIVAGTSNHTTTYTTKQGKGARGITAAEYRDVVSKTFLPQGQLLLGGRGANSWILQQDNDPTHRVAPTTVEKYNKAYSSSVSVLAPWPPHSPDLNIIENVWSWVDREVRAKGCKTFAEFKAAVREVVKSVPKSMLTNLYKSIPKRLAEVIRVKGGRTGY